MLAAKMEYLRKNKQDPFRNLNLPQAIIRFKQGFGRLVRSQQDTGFVVVMDTRIIEKYYGKKFLNSLPLKTHFRGNSQDIIQMIKNKRQTNMEPVS
jgi:ATP-dependent DNA helicase DinG